MSRGRKRRVCKAARSDADYEIIRARERDHTTTSCSALDRLPTPMREQYLADCLAGDTAYRHLVQARWLLDGMRP
jgi:hypothetical protein